MRVITSNEHAKAIPGYLIDAFVSSLDGELINPRSRSNYRNALRAVERYLFDEMLVMEEIDSGIVQDVRDWLLSEYSPGTARNYFSVFRSFLSWFEGLGGGGAHTASRLSMPSHDASGVAVLTEGQAFSVMSAATDGTTAEISARNGAIVALMLFCAFDVGRWGCSAKGFIVPLGRATGPVLSQIEARKAARYEPAGATGGESPLFSSLSNRTRGSRLASRSIREIVEKIIERAGVSGPGVSAASLRKTAVRVASDRGATCSEIMSFARIGSFETAVRASGRLPGDF